MLVGDATVRGTVRTLLADGATGLPDLTGGQVERARELAETQLDAVYFDTDDLRLVRSGVRVRRDADGDAAGWHVRIGPSASRLEFRFPQTRSERVPMAIRKLTQGIARGAPLVPVARVRSHRQRVQLLGGQDAVLAEVGRDRVVATRSVDGVETEWHEIEVRLVSGDTGVRDRVLSRLVGNGAAEADFPSRLRRALGDRNPSKVPTPSKKAAAADVLRAYLAEVHVRLLRHDLRLRADQPDAVHLVRTNARRLRSALAAYRKLFEPDSTRRLEDGLRWLGTELSVARDLQVADELLAEATPAHAVSPALVLAVQPVRKELAARRRANAAEVTRLLESDTYLRLLDDLAAFVEAPPFRSRAAKPARRELRRGLRAAHRRVTEQWATARASLAADALHDVRKAVKRLRYACEVAEPVLGDDARRLRQQAKSLSEVLGERQDALLVQRTLAEMLPTLGAGAAARDASFELGQLKARQDASIHELEDRAVMQIGLLHSPSAAGWLG